MNSSLGPLFQPYVASSTYRSASGRQSRCASHSLLVSSHRCHMASISSRRYAGMSALLEMQGVRRAVAHGCLDLVLESRRRRGIENSHLPVVTEREDLGSLNGALGMTL